MKKASTSAPGPVDEFVPEYRFDYRKAKPNRFAGEDQKKGMSVVLNEEVAEV